MLEDKLYGALRTHCTQHTFWYGGYVIYYILNTYPNKDAHCQSWNLGSKHCWCIQPSNTADINYILSTNFHDSLAIYTVMSVTMASIVARLLNIY